MTEDCVRATAAVAAPAEIAFDLLADPAGPPLDPDVPVLPAVDPDPLRTSLAHLADLAGR